MIKSILAIVFLAFGLQASWGFALLGPLPTYTGLPTEFEDAWQIIDIGYGGGDIGGPKNLGEEYRLNTPVLYYSYDASFMDFFGSNGVAAVDSAFAILNALTNVDSYSPDLSEFALNSQSINFKAQAVGLLDLKSMALSMMMEQMGLGEPERFAWTLHDRHLPSGGTCPEDVYYLVVQRNFDFMPSQPSQSQYSAYVNGTLYTYYIVGRCTKPPNTLAETVVFSPDPFANTYTAVANRGDGLLYGGFYTGLTRDDVAGLRYLLSTNNPNWESATVGSVLTSSSSGTTNYGAPYVLYTSNYTAFVSTAQTNSPAILTNLFPGLIVNNYSTYPVVVSNANVVSYYTNNGSAGNPPFLVVTTNGYNETVVVNYLYNFANVIVTNASPNTSAKLMTVQVRQNGSAGNGLYTNTTFQQYTLTNVPSGDYFITTNPCGVNILYQLPFANVVASTNVITATSNSAGLFYSQSIVTYTTNHAYWVEPFICSGGGTLGVSNATGLYQGVGKIQFVSAPYDSLLGQSFQPILSTYTNVVISGSLAQKQTFQRLLLAPDIIFAAIDLATPNPHVAEIGVGGLLRNVNWNVQNLKNQTAGPGTINPPSMISFNKAGNVYGNGSLALNFMSTNQFLSEYTQMKGWVASSNVDFTYGLLTWASFDSSTNDPVIYPNGTSIQNLENQVLVRITLTDMLTGNTLTGLTDGTNGAVYPSLQITASGGAFTRPFTWSATGLPPGLTVTTVNDTAVISGIPSLPPAMPRPQTFNNVVLQLSDALTPPRTVSWTFSITIQ